MVMCENKSVPVTASVVASQKLLPINSAPIPKILAMNFFSMVDSYSGKLQNFPNAILKL
jgi:hypothetical protein